MTISREQLEAAMRRHIRNWKPEISTEEAALIAKETCDNSDLFQQNGDELSGDFLEAVNAAISNRKING